MRRRHAFEGQDLEVFSHTTRGGRLILILTLPDGSRSLIPAAWTDWPGSEASSPVPIADPLNLIGESDDLLSIRSHVDALLQRTRSEESRHATDTESSGVTDQQRQDVIDQLSKIVANLAVATVRQETKDD